jgi:tetratricopeptide (TPR) repeat protein
MSYGSRDVARMLGITAAQVRAFVRAGVLDPDRGTRGELRFSFQDLVLLRTAHGLVSARVPARRVRSALSRLRAQLPEGRPLSGVQIATDGDRIVVGDGGRRWQPESGQVLFDFDTADLEREVARLERRRAEEAAAAGADGEEGVEVLFQRASRVDEEGDVAAAIAAYRTLLDVAPGHVEARINLGRLLHDMGDAAAAAVEYRRALDAQPKSAVAAFNLGVALEDGARFDEAAAAYAAALAADPRLADAHFNLSRLHERAGRRLEALRHLKAYRSLVKR